MTFVSLKALWAALVSGLILCFTLGVSRADDAPAPAAMSIDQLKSRAEAGDALFQQRLGMAYYNGQGVAKDNTQAFAWCLKAADQGNTEAQFNVAYFFANGLGVTKDSAVAFQRYLKLANQGYPMAELSVSEDYFSGAGVTKDIPRAMTWAQKAATQGNSTAQVFLGISYVKDHNSPENVKKGFTYLLLNSKDHGDAAYWVARCYQQGIFVSADPIEAYMWGLHASRLTNLDDLTKLMAFLKTQLNGDQINEAYQRLLRLSDFLAGQIQTPDLTCTFAQGASSLIHFKFTQNFILIPVQTQDQQPVYLMFDTGASVSMLKMDFATKMGLKRNTYIPVTGIGENIDLSAISDSTTFSLPGITFSKARWSILHDYPFDAEVGQPVVGIMGLDLVKQFVIRFDFVNQTIEFMKPGRFRPSEADGVCLQITLKPLGVYIDGTVIDNQASAKGNFLFDTGDTGSIDLAKFFQDQNPFLTFKTLAVGGSSGIGGSALSSIVTCSSVQLGNLNLPSPRIDLDQAIQGIGVGFNGGTIGNEIWRRFDLVLDLPDRKLYLQKNANFSKPYNYVSAGIHIMASGVHYETLSVHEVLPSSPAARAGFQTGDLLIRVDELGTDPLTMDNVYPILHKPGTCHFLVQRNGQTLPLVLKLIDPLAQAEK